MVTIVAVFVVGLTWYFLQQLVAYVYALMSWMYPTKTSDNSIAFSMAVWSRLPILALIGIGIFAFVNSQKRPRDQY